MSKIELSMVKPIIDKQYRKSLKSVSDTAKLFRAHPFMIFTYLKPYLFILLIPVIRGALNYGSSETLPQLLIGEIVLAAIITMIALIKWRRCMLIIEKNFIRIRMGFLFTTDAIIPISKIASTYLETKPILWAARGVLLRLDTEAGRTGKSDFEIILPLRRVGELSELLPASGDEVLKYNAPTIKIFIMAAATSSAATGLLVAAPLINQAGQLLDEGLSDRVYNTINHAASLFEQLVPPVASTLSVIFLAGFVISFFISLSKNAPFRLYKKGGRFLATSGLISHRKIRFNADAINETTILQSPLMRLFHHYTVKVCVAGYGKKKGETAMMIPAAREKDYQVFLRELSPVKEGVPKSDSTFLKSPARAKARFVRIPMIITLAIPLAGKIISLYLVPFEPLIRFFCAIFIAYIGIMVYVSYTKYKHGGISVGDEHKAYSAKGLSLTEVHVRNNRTGVIRMTENPFDRKSKLCSLRLTVRSESATSLNIANLDSEQIKRELCDFYKIKLI